MTIEQKEEKKIPPLAESVKRIFDSFDKMAKQSVTAAKLLKQAQEELKKRESIIKNQAEEIERLKAKHIKDTRWALTRMDESRCDAIRLGKVLSQERIDTYRRLNEDNVFINELLDIIEKLQSGGESPC